MTNLFDISYVRLGTRDRATADRFASDVLGLERVREENAASYFRSDDRDHTLVYVDGDPADHTVGFEVRTAGDLECAAAELSDAGFDVRAGSLGECEQRRVKSFIRFDDPTGNRIELAFSAYRSGRRYFPSRDAGVTGFSHVGLCTTDPQRDERFWTGLLGARVSDWIGDAPLLRIDEIHHKIALFPTARAGVQHINHQVESIDDVMRSWYLLREKGVPIAFGPGRHPTSGAVFLYFRGPDGMIYEFSTGVRSIRPEEEATYKPRQFAPARESFCAWGAVPDIAEFRAAAQKSEAVW
ncbi:2,3-dihydroxy-p-cumate/2,3-dihydroxybenzoate 3,4-dioxygenase [Paraburkholderia sp. BL23I1N1]|uniref:VOC family protein n=1 Tax=Paraburkholderia sp. BL23I1N1 TaxID=1938802 RepID=UPI000E737553|nr:VOC family protein [Paraburkholderia sp. BL23I1N1]RKE38637.1 2,3-dihydroxy-p-cumate/2,3-dihydroxybenzoate 3,4-dioxygenase [Paraburkholderia sp. BL23I1N1]